MKKVNDTPRLLIYHDAEMHEINNKLLEEILSNIRKLKALFDLAGIPFSKNAFILILTKGSTWLTDILYEKLKATYLRDGFSDSLIESLKSEEFAKLEEYVKPCEPILINIKELLNKIELSPNQIPFDEHCEPLITKELKKILIEKSNKFLIGAKEIEIFQIMKDFALIANKLESHLCKHSFPMLFTLYTKHIFQVPFAETVHSLSPFFIANYDELESIGHAVLKINPYFFEDISRIKEAKTFTAEMQRTMPALRPDKTFVEFPEGDVSAGVFRLPKTVGPLLDDFHANPDKPRPDRGKWKGFKD